jgi:hypothetical protein
MRYLLSSAGTFVLAVLISGCAEPEMLYHATPVSDDTVWYSGREFVTQTKDSVTVSVAFENEFNGVLTFYVVVGNNGSQAVLVSPENINCAGSYHDVRAIYNSRTDVTRYDTVSSADTLYALDPETQLQGIDRQMAQANATYSNQTGLNVAAGLLQIVGDVATIGQQKSREEIHREDESRRSIQESQESNNVNYSLQSASLADQRAYWESVALRKTTLFQYNAIGGKVRIPAVSMAGVLNLFIPVGPNVFTFEFSQKPLSPQ